MSFLRSQIAVELVGKNRKLMMMVCLRFDAGNGLTKELRELGRGSSYTLLSVSNFMFELAEVLAIDFVWLVDPYFSGFAVMTNGVRQTDYVETGAEEWVAQRATVYLDCGIIRFELSLTTQRVRLVSP